MFDVLIECVKIGEGNLFDFFVKVVCVMVMVGEIFFVMEKVFDCYKVEIKLILGVYKWEVGVMFGIMEKVYFFVGVFEDNDGWWLCIFVVKMG